MARLHLLVEGQTEEVLCDRVLIPHLVARGWRSVTTSILSTRRLASGAKYRGGVSGWERIRREIIRLLPSFDVVTTMIDYYGFPTGAPGMDDRPAAGANDRVRHVERAIGAALDDWRFVPHLTLHETEAWVFAAAGKLAELLDDRLLADDLRKIADDAGGVELINDDPATAPSKRLEQRLPAYQKTLHGPLSVQELGLADLRGQCPHLEAWLTELERRAE